MNLGKLFESSKDFQLDKGTFVNLRWIALLGQFATINVVKLVFQFEFYFLVCNFIVGIGVLTNLFLKFKIKQNQLNNNLSTIYLAYDKSNIEILAIGIGHDVSRYYRKAIKIADVQELGDVMIDQLSNLFGKKTSRLLN